MAVSDLADIFSSLKDSTAYKTPQNFVNVLTKWKDKYSEVSLNEKLNPKQFVLMAGNI